MECRCHGKLSLMTEVMLSDKFRFGIFLKISICLKPLMKTGNTLHLIMLLKWWVTLDCHHFTFSSEVKKYAMCLIKVVSLSMSRHK